MQRLITGVMLIALWLLWTVNAQAAPSNKQRFEYLSQQQQTLQQAITEATHELSHRPASEQLTQASKKNEEKLSLNHVNIQSLRFQLETQQAQLDELNERLKSLQRTSIHYAANTDIAKQLAAAAAAYATGKMNVALLTKNLSLAYAYESLLFKVHDQLCFTLALLQRDQQFALLNAAAAQLETQLNERYAEGVQLSKQLLQTTDEHQRLVDEEQTLLNSQAIDLLQLKLARVWLNKKWVEAAYLLKKSPNVSTLEGVRAIYKAGADALESQTKTLKAQAIQLKAIQKRGLSPALQQACQALQDDLQAQLQEVNIQYQILQEDLENDGIILSQQLSVRSRLPDLRPASWVGLAVTVSHIPLLFSQYVKNITYKVYENMVWQDWTLNVLVFLAVLSLWIGGMGLRLFLRRNIQAPSSRRLTSHVYRGALILIYKNTYDVIFLLSLWVLFALNGVRYAAYQLLFNLGGVFIFFKSLYLISRLMFIEGEFDETGHDVKLHQHLTWLVWAGVLSTSLMVFGYQLHLNEWSQAFFNRVFMLFLLVVSVVLWRSQAAMTHFLLPLLVNQKRYVMRMARILLFLLPITLLSTAVIGLSGYNNLAWRLSQYQAQFLVLVALYVLVRGLLVDAFEILSEWMVRSLYNGWLWIEVLLKPLDQIARFALWLMAVACFCYILEEATSLQIFSFLSTITEDHLVRSPGVEITVLSALQFLMVACFFFWVAKWTREFCYRFVYRQVRDVGIRNSLAVFTQYAVIVVGGFIALQILGFDFAGLSFVLGGLAVGMGLGLRDFANNIVGGLILLIERPVREGDLITLGEHEGRVAHIGIRSMRVCSWDNMEVLIPNAETFSKPFINWTHQDSIVRTVFPIKVSREDDPAVVQTILLDILTHTPEVLSHPEPQAFLTQIDDALMSFEARYFINVNVHTRFEVRSKILFAVLERFKAAGIKAPIPPFHIALESRENVECQRVT